MSYFYASNLDSLDRRDQLEIQMDNGSTAILRKGHFYDLTVNELSRASQYIVLTSSVTPPDESPIAITYLPVKGTPTQGQVPAWSASQGVFIPTTPSGGGSSSADLAALDARVQLLEIDGVKSSVFNEGSGSWPARPEATTVLWVGGGATDDPTTLMADGDIWFPSG